ncbi:hypothetical protein FJY68_12010 [candidate division WOR-3 bacterium]|uniref:Uncharacterized protein n=1 Tax=candidate division WOR-3 bacterium TaxID=2052148 RepID=A0A938BSE8_UNCW3|nr:hypothetical protein [candidate division WOR-3 bacterium]
MVRSLPSVLTWHRRHYPLLRAPDIYKLVHQGVFGPGHLVASERRARARLMDELQVLATQARRQRAEAASQRWEEELIEEIYPRGKLVRVNLRPLFAAQFKLQSAECKMQNSRWLVEAMVESAIRVKGNPEQMKRRLAAAVRWCRSGLPRQAADLERLAAEAAASGYPAYHHSPTYARAYRPAYRVLLASCLGKDGHWTTVRERS